VKARLLRLAQLVAAERRGVGLGVLLQAATVTSGVLLMGTSAWLIARAAQRPSIGALGVAIAGVRFFGIARGIFRYLERLASHDATLRVAARLRALLYARLEPLAPARLMGERSGDVLARLMGDVEVLESAYLRVVSPTVAALLVAALVSAFLLARGPALAAVFLAALALGGVLAPALSGRLAGESGRRLVGMRGELQALLVDGIQGVADVLAFGREGAHARDVRRLARAVDAEEARLARASAWGAAVGSLAADLGAAFVLVLAVAAVRAGRLDGMEIAVLPLLSLAAFEAVAPLPLAYRALGATREAARRVFELIDAEPPVVDPVSPEPAGAGERLEVRGLRFRYPDGTLALDGVDVTLERGRLVAVVGPSGSGKSTLASLLLRYWEAPPGAVLLDGTDVRRLSADAVRARIAFVSPSERAFAGTVRENLLLARPGASESELREALTSAGLGAFCGALQGGLDTWVGEHGLGLSGGERQRLLLARAFLRCAPLLVADEPTAHLDAHNERHVLASILAGRQRRATLLITHRLSGLEPADEILVLIGGRVVERGSWDQLVAARGVFARMLAAERDAEALRGQESGSG
jgi:thiol reductant ABC exporter CydC subunit